MPAGTNARVHTCMHVYVWCIRQTHMRARARTHIWPHARTPAHTTHTHTYARMHSRLNLNSLIQLTHGCVHRCVRSATPSTKMTEQTQLEALHAPPLCPHRHPQHPLTTPCPVATCQGSFCFANRALGLLETVKARGVSLTHAHAYTFIDPIWSHCPLPDTRLSKYGAFKVWSKQQEILSPGSLGSNSIVRW